VKLKSLIPYVLLWVGQCKINAKPHLPTVTKSRHKRMDLVWRFRTEKFLVMAGCIASSFLFFSFLDTFLVGGMREEKEGLLCIASKRSDAGFRRLWSTSRGTMLEGKDVECRRVQRG